MGSGNSHRPSGTGNNPDVVRKSLSESFKSGFKFGSPVGRGRSSCGYDAYDYFNPELRGREPGLDSSRYHGYQPRQLRSELSEGHSLARRGYEDPWASESTKRKHEEPNQKMKFDPYTGERLAPPSPKAKFNPYTGQPLDTHADAVPYRKPDIDFNKKEQNKQNKTEDSLRLFQDEADEIDIADDAELSKLLHSSTPNKPPGNRRTRSLKDNKDTFDVIDSFTDSEDRNRREHDLAEERDKEVKLAESKTKKYKPFLTRRITDAHLATMKQNIASIQRYIGKSVTGADSFFHSIACFCPEYAALDEADASKRLRHQLALYMANQEHFTSVSTFCLNFFATFLKCAMCPLNILKSANTVVFALYDMIFLFLQSGLTEGLPG